MNSLLAPRVLIPRNIKPPRHAFATAVSSSVRSGPPQTPIPIVRTGTPSERPHKSTLANSHTDVDSSTLLSPTHRASLRSQSTPMQEYQKLVQVGALKSDDHQTRIIQKLQALHNALAVYNPPSRGSSLFSLFFSGPAKSADNTSRPHGLYLYGDVGAGKTMLMDIFYNTLPAHITHKRRVHFHAFMFDIHKRMHAAKAAGVGDPLVPVARDLANEAHVLCLDEFQVTDIADAMILRRLLDSLVEQGVVCMLTSNRHPDELYKHGIQRASFLPAIDLLKSQFDVTVLDSGTDYRRVPRALSHAYFSPLNNTTRAAINAQFDALTEGLPVQNNETIRLWGRDLTVPRSAGSIAQFAFADLCGQPLGTADYLELTQRYGTLFVTDVPRMGPNEKDKARRFVTFIDACYESKTRLFVSSEVPIFGIISDDPGRTPGAPVTDHMRSIMDDLGLPVEVVRAASMFSGEEELFAFARCCSRLVHMGSADWMEHAGRR